MAILPSRETENPYPDLGQRLLACVKFWNAIDAHFAYPHLMDVPWKNSLTGRLPAFAQARNALEYQQAVARMLTLLQDSHGTFMRTSEEHPALDLEKFLGEAILPGFVQMIDGKVVVTAIGHESLAEAGLKVGDVILSVDGEETRPGGIQVNQEASLNSVRGELINRQSHKALEVARDRTAHAINLFPRVCGCGDLFPFLEQTAQGGGLS